MANSEWDFLARQDPRLGSKILMLTGPTGVGKTDLAVRLAQRFPVEIISADSMQVYRGLEIGTAQPSSDQQRQARFHLCGTLEPTEPFSVQRFMELCDKAHREILGRGRVPLYVGGTGMYLRALRWGLFDEECSNDEVRSALEEEVREQGPQALHRRLVELDPAAADRIASADRIRIVRALEVQAVTGRRLSELQSQWARPQSRFPHVLMVLTAPREEIRRCIARRAEAMLKAGWVREVACLLEQGVPQHQHCFNALGYREIIGHLQGRLKESELLQLIVTRTHEFAKRQMVWFRREKPALWLPAGEGEWGTLGQRLEKLLAKLGTPLV